MGTRTYGEDMRRQVFGSVVLLLINTAALERAESMIRDIPARLDNAGLCALPALRRVNPEEAVGMLSCPPDIDNCGAVGSGDLNTMLAEFGCAEGCENDADGDGDVDSGDVNAVLGAFGEACP